MSEYNERFSKEGIRKKKEKREDILRVLRQRLCKITEQRIILIDFILGSEDMTSKEIYIEIIKKYPGIGIATVYRTIKILEEIGAIRIERTCSRVRIKHH